MGEKRLYRRFPPKYYMYIAGLPGGQLLWEKNCFTTPVPYPGITGHNFTKIAWMLHLRIDDRGFKAFEARCPVKVISKYLLVKFTPKVDG